jgi:hypothetical protein
MFTTIINGSYSETDTKLSIFNVTKQSLQISLALFFSIAACLNSERMS